MSHPIHSDGCPNTPQEGLWVLEEYMEASPSSSLQNLELSEVVTTHPNCGLGEVWIPSTHLLSSLVRNLQREVER